MLVRKEEEMGFKCEIIFDSFLPRRFLPVFSSGQIQNTCFLAKK